MNPLQHVLCVLLCLFAVFIPGLHFRVQTSLVGHMNCYPSSPIGCSKVTTVEVQVNKTTYDGVCTANGSSDHIVFQRIEGEGSAQSVRSCEVRSVRQSPCSWPNNQLGCGCLGATEEVYVLQYSFQAATVTQIYLQASVNCTTREGLGVRIAFPTCTFPVRTTLGPPKMIKNNLKVLRSELTGEGSRSTRPTLWILAGPVATSLMLLLQ